MLNGYDCFAGRERQNSNPNWQICDCLEFMTEESTFSAKIRRESHLDVCKTIKSSMMSSISA